MAPERAFGVISRAKQCVVVGDPKQLPPTAFFQRSTSTEDTEQNEEVDTEALDEESILDLCTKSFHPVRRLKWHYRSRHGSLIAFSNKHFYNNELVVFPSCDRDFAISRHLVEAPRYTKGVNLPEVKQVCDVVLQQLEEHPERSIGVVAMNEAQSEEIAEQLEMLSIHHDELRRRLELTDSSEGLFVKSLEKVQGDERDTIVISTTYGPAEPGGGVAMRFGPINQNGGHRRLNVLFTRAKYGIKLVTSMESHQIQPTATSSQGVHALKGYLKFVESQSLETGRQSGREPDSEFEIVVAEALTRHGYQVDCQVGVANYFIDLAIRHPDKLETYLIGIECDGATYHSARSARDRDKYRQAVLEGLGWQIYRIWSTDWFENQESETKKLVAHVEVLIGRAS
jgi:very-short-patch-repair endonuclease